MALRQFRSFSVDYNRFKNVNMSANKDHCLHLLLQSYAAWFSAAAAAAVPSVLQSASVGPSSEKRRGERERGALDAPHAQLTPRGAHGETQGCKLQDLGSKLDI